MNIITISREFGSGGREIGKRLADLLDYEYYDKEIIAEIAKNKQLDETYVEAALNNRAWKVAPITFRRSFSGYAAATGNQTSLLLEQKRVVESIGKAGKNCVVVGRNADVLLGDYAPFNVFVCADVETKLRRCQERAANDENLTEKQLLKKMREIDKARAETREILTGKPFGACNSYHLSVNTSAWDIKELTEAIAEFAKRYFSKANGR